VTRGNGGNIARSNNFLNSCGKKNYALSLEPEGE
jgi:hypothetical protein